MRNLFRFLAVSFLISQAHAAQPMTVPDANCREDVTDPNDVGYRLTEVSNLYSGQCVNGERFRPIKNLVLDQNQAVFDNYVHEDRFWKATVPLNGNTVKTVYMQVMRFPVLDGKIIAAHLQTRFVMKDNSQVTLTRGTETRTSNDVLVSFEAGFPKGENYDFLKGRFSNYARLSVVMSTLQKNLKPNHGIEQYEIDLTDDEKTLLLKNSLEYSHKIQMTEVYDTLRPNCATEAYDLLDGLPRFKGQFKPFLTSFWLDPIAGPSIEALQQRGLLKRRVQDFASELTPQFTGESTELEIPKNETFVTAFLPNVDSRPWTLVSVLPDTSSLTPAERAALKELQTELVLAIPELLQSYGTAAVLAPEGEAGQRIFLTTLKELVSRIPVYLRKVNANLPEEAMQMSFYLAPYASSADTVTDLLSYGIPAQIPFNMYNHQLDGSSGSYEIFYWLGQGLLQAGQVGVSHSNGKGFLMGAAVVIEAEKNNSQVYTQIAAGLEALSAPLDNKTKEVNLDGFVIPSMDETDYRPTLLLTHAQEVKNETINPNVDIQFGSLGGIGGVFSEFSSGAIQIYKDGGCSGQTASAPYFKGVLQETPSGNGFVDFIISGNDVKFHLVRMSMNLEQQKIESMDLMMSTGFTGLLSCINMDNVDQKFTDNANAAITGILNKATENPLLQRLSPLLQ